MAKSRSRPRPARPKASPRYQKLADRLIAEIRSGRLRVGDTLSGELELRDRFGVSRHTVREALRQLEGLGLIERTQGSGTVITARAPTETYVQSLRSPAQLLQYPEDTRLEIVSGGPVVASRALARELDCATGSSWYLLRGIRRVAATGRALCWSDIYVVPQYAPVAEMIGRRRQPVFELIEREFGERVAHVRVDIRASRVPAARAEALGVEPGSPALDVIRRYTGNGGRVFEISLSSHPADRYTYSLEVRRGWQSGDGWASNQG
jgi:DNA-binding GntR family transcriptional regulator